MANYSQTFSISGLETLTIVMPVAGQFSMDCKMSLPIQSQGATSPSQVIATVKQNGTTIFTSTQGQIGFTIPIQCASQDTFTVALSSSQAEDQVLNAVKARISIG